ncbi:MAG: hypothetical protein L6R42_002480 [Xanthoria sp. 1 TBL-2021]|nr:MAG: hypothetical protein L6R42_002480 [Xanthoria sp. 1 TBL-2021]
MVTLAATYDPSRYSRHLGILNDLINIWGESNYFPSSVVAVLRDTLTNATDGSMSAAQNTEPSETRIDTAGNGIGGIQKDAPYIMPASHGDASVPFYDLPAGNLLPCIIPNSLTLISPQMVKPLQFRAGPADEELAHAVKAFLKDIDVLYGYRLPGQGYDRSDIDQLGQPTALDNTPEDIPASEGYYGWSKAFCEKMKLRSSGDRRASSPPRLECNISVKIARSRSYSPPDVAAPQPRDGHLDDNATPGLAGEQPSQVVPLPPAFLQQSFLNPGQIPIPPPPPPNYTGPWPPPPPPPPSLSAPKFTPQKPAQIPPLPTYALDKSASSPSPQYPSHVSSLGTAQTFYGQASGNFPSQAYQGSSDHPNSQPGRRQAPPAGGARGRGAQW